MSYNRVRWVRDAAAESAGVSISPRSPAHSRTRPLQVTHEQHHEFIHESPVVDVLWSFDDAMVDRRVRRRRHHPHRELDVGYALGRPFEEASHFGEYRRVRLLD